MGTPEHKRSIVDLSRLEILDVNLRKALEDQKILNAYVDKLKKQIRDEMGDNEVAEVNGVVRYTYAETDGYQWARFANEHGQVAEKYKITVQTETLDKEGLLRDHPALLKEFRTRQFLVK